LHNATNISLSRESTRAFQRKLYVKAKQEERMRFYSVYDKISRLDILHHAYDLVRANNSSPGVDGCTFAQIETIEGRAAFIEQVHSELVNKCYRAQAVKRVYIPKGNGEQRPLGIPTIKDRVVQMATKLVLEPIFEADFSDHSYGYRPKRHAHQAIDAISQAMRQGCTQVIDADLSKYFDTIAHDKLLRTIAERVSDGAVMALLKQWLKAPVCEVDERGRTTWVGGGQSSRVGTPQGGVISPLLANIYLNLLDRIWERHEIEKRYSARLVRYADDMVILCRRGTEQPLALLKKVLFRLGLSLNENKTGIINTHKGRFNFLGFSLGMKCSKRTGNWFPHIEATMSSIKRLKDKLKRLTRRQMALVPIGDIMKMLNAIVRGWCNYFHYGHSSRLFTKVRTFLEQRLRLHLSHRHKLKYRLAGFRRFPRRVLYEEYNLYRINTKSPWILANA
jgi:RNA-directed DNA polymerase